MSMKNFNKIIENGTRDLPACRRSRKKTLFLLRGPPSFLFDMWAQGAFMQG